MQDCKGPGQELVDQAMAAMCEDLNSAAVLGAVSNPLTTMNDLLYARKVCPLPIALPILLFC